MTPEQKQLLIAIERHAIDDMDLLLGNGLNPCLPIDSKLPMQWLLEMYTRSTRFSDCVRVLLNYGASVGDNLLQQVLLQDVDTLTKSIQNDMSAVHHRVNIRCAYTPLLGASLLHVAAEYGLIESTKRLIALGADVNCPADIDEHGFNGQTPIFHTVNSANNLNAPILTLLIEAGAKPDKRLPGIVWGRGFEWETICFDVSPISYAQLGLLPQMHRDELQIYQNIQTLMAASGRAHPLITNVPNAYLG